MEIIEDLRKECIIEFTCWDEDEPMNIQLEPEATNFELKPGSEIKFIAINCGNKFYWSVKIDNKRNNIQLYPESSSGSCGSINVYIDGQVVA